MAHSLFQSRRMAAVLCALALLLTGFFAVLNLRVPSAGIVQDALLDTDNRYARWDAEARDRSFVNQGEALSLVLSFPQGMDRAALDQVLRLTDEAQALFPEGRVWSLARNAVDYQADGATLRSEPWLSAARLARTDFDLAAWRAGVAADRSVLGTLVGPAFDHTQILVFLPADYDEQGVVDRIAEHLEQRSISKLEWLLWKGDIQPVAAYANVSLGGWSVARGLMHYALISDVMRYSTLGLLLATLAAVFSLGSWRQALQVSGLILISFVVARGSITLMADWGLRFWGHPVYERVYFLLVMSALIVSGLSLFVRAFEAFNEQWRADPEADAAELWRRVRPQQARFNVVIAIAVLNFATLPQIGIRGLLEVGVLSAIGLLTQRLMVSTLLPAMHVWLGGRPQELAGRWPGMQAYQRAVRRVPRMAYALLQRLGPQRGLALALGLTGLSLAAALGVVVHDARHPAEARWIAVQERPIDYLPGTIVDRARHLLNRPDGLGFARLNFLAQPSGGGEVTDPQFLADVAALQRRMAMLPGALPVRSVLDKLAEVQAKTEGLPLVGDGLGALPASTAQAHEQLQLIRWDFADAALADYFWARDGVVVFAAHAADNSRDLRQFADAVMQLAQAEFPRLRVLPFGRLHTYHQTDEYISQGKPLNVLLSFPLVLGICWFWLVWAQRGGSAGSQLSPWRGALALCLPFVFAYALVIVVMALFGLPLDQATACATALGINAAVDFGFYLLEDFRQALAQRGDAEAALHEALAERGQVTVIDAKLNTVCFSLLLMSSFVPIQRLGLLLILLLLACAFGVLFLMTGVLRHCVRRRASAPQTQPELSA
ncbi:hypothetical protein [Inhella gelatinilytica]|uniref:SSD domain-containing protein n=1 Tax=Inhella gelatinilytica TaxID=2795030 RepID=A0A931NDK7_9BURK|nr:hypothetical protein [Inhella gelatinilytica]MBH9552709.1 hypothetical protein [Inhella gelatinilytica]